jgi:hypothetical protein
MLCVIPVASRMLACIGHREPVAISVITKSRLIAERIGDVRERTEGIVCNVNRAAQRIRLLD